LNREIGNIEIDPLTAPRSIQAIIALYGQLNQAQSRHPGTDLVLRYEVKPHPPHCMNYLSMSGVLDPVSYG